LHYVSCNASNPGLIPHNRWYVRVHQATAGARAGGGNRKGREE